MSIEDKNPRIKHIYNNFVGNLTFSELYNDFVSIRDSIMTLNLGDQSESSGIDKIYLGENSIVKMLNFKKTVIDKINGKSIIAKNSLCFDLDWDRPYKFYHFTLGKDLYVFATDDSDDKNRNIRSMAVLKNFGELDITNIYFIDRFGLERNVHLGDDNKANKIDLVTNLPDFIQIANGLVTVFKDADNEQKTPEIETGLKSVLDIFRDGFSVDDAVRGYSLPPNKSQKKKGYSKP